MDKNKVTTAAVVAGIVGIVVGGGAGYAISNNMDDKNDNGSMSQSVSEANPKTDTKAAGVRVALNNLLREHVTTNIATNQAIAMGADEGEVAGAKAAETANAVAIATAIGGIFGQEAQDAITPLFVDHIEQSNAIAQAIADGDEGAQKTAETELNEYLDDISAFFSGAINDLPQETVRDLLAEHESLVTRAGSEFKAGNFEASYATEAEATAQVATIADALAAGIVATLPDQF